MKKTPSLIHKNRTRTLFLALLLSLPLSLLATDWQTLAAQGDKAYAAKDYRRAAEQYGKAVAALPEGEQSAGLQYNLGNAHFKNGQLGQAILAYERAARLSPNDGDIRYNLDVARERVKGGIVPVNEFFIVNWWRMVRGLLSSGAWAIIGLFLLWLGIAAALTWLFSKERRIRKISFFIALGALSLGALPFLLAWGQHLNEQDDSRAVLMVTQTPLRSSPDGTADFDIHEGTSLEVLDRIGKWAKVRLINGDVGWVLWDDIEKI